MVPCNERPHFQRAPVAIFSTAVALRWPCAASTQSISLRFQYFRPWMTLAGGKASLGSRCHRQIVMAVTPRYAAVRAAPSHSDSLSDVGGSPTYKDSLFITHVSAH